MKDIGHEFGEPGSPIKGSAFVRWYCEGCNRPMRVPITPWPPETRICEFCAGAHSQPPGGGAFPIDDITGYQANAIRAMDGD